VGEVSAAEAGFFREVVRDVEEGEEIACDGGVGAAAEIDGELGAEVAVVEVLDGEEEGTLAGAVHVDEGAVDVPEDE